MSVFLRIKTPKFWYCRDNFFQKLLSILLWPASILYLLGYWLKYLGEQLFKTTLHPPAIPVICVGNLTAGGSGKTPAAILVMSLVKKYNLAKNPAFLTRGYGRDIQTKTDKTTPFKIASDDPATKIGDEAQLLRAHGDVYVCSDRMAGLEYAQAHGVDCLILDDGYQNRAIDYSLRILVVNKYDGFGNGYLLPAGPLREPLSRGLARADYMLEIEDARCHPENTRPNKIPLDQAKPQNKGLARIAPIASLKKETLKDQQYLAFSGIARPEKFFATLRDLGYCLAQCREFPDHHAYSAKDIEELKALAGRDNLRLITTQKDIVRLPRHKNGIHQDDVETLEIGLELPQKDEMALLTHLRYATNI